MNLIDYENFQRNYSGGLSALMMSRRRLGKTSGQMHRISLIRNSAEWRLATFQMSACDA